MDEQKPLLSYLMICYNQERTIGEALESALAQEGEVVEIVVSDDHSSDRTYEIARETAGRYRGPHRVILHRNERNLGIGGNFQEAYRLSHGEWLVMAAGDDISYAGRSRMLRELISGSSPDVRAICTTREIIDSDGRSRGYDWWRKAAYGASTAWHRSLFEDYPPIPAGLMYEDAFLSFRLFMGGYRLLQARTPSMKYRVDGVSVTSRGQRTALETQRKVLVMVERLRKILAAVECELSFVRGTSRESWEEHLTELRRVLSEREQTAHEAVSVLQGGMVSNLGYLLRDNDTAGHRSFRERLGWALRSESVWYGLWRRWRQGGSGCGEYAPVIPDSVADEVMDAEAFLRGDFPVSF